jgi:hypothetical protein
MSISSDRPRPVSPEAAPPLCVTDETGLVTRFPEGAFREAAPPRATTPPESKWIRLPPDHAEHGLGSAEDGPDDSDCGCRDTEKQTECANAGCGFCRAATPGRERFARWEPDGRWVCECGAKSCGADFPGPTSCCFTLRPPRSPLAGSPPTTPEPQYGPLVDVPYDEADWPRWLMLVAEREPRGRNKATFAALSRSLAEPSPESGAPSLSREIVVLLDEYQRAIIRAHSTLRAYDFVAEEAARAAVDRRLSTLERDAARMREALTEAADELENDPKTRTCYNVAAAIRTVLAPSGEPTTERRDNG